MYARGKERKDGTQGRMRAARVYLGLPPLAVTLAPRTRHPIQSPGRFASVEIPRFFAPQALARCLRSRQEPFPVRFFSSVYGVLPAAGGSARSILAFLSLSRFSRG